MAITMSNLAQVAHVRRDLPRALELLECATWWDNGQPRAEIEWEAGKHHGLSKT